MDIPLYKVKYENEDQGDLYAISIVQDPANGFEFIAMSEYKEIKLASDKKKQILYGIVLRPEQKIYREFEDGTPFYLTFDAETIERFSQDFMKKGYQNNSTYNHNSNEKLNDITVTEQWIVMDKTNDKGNVIGLPVENGDWIVGMQLSDKSWNEYIETGKATGFSIDSFIQFEKVNMKCVDYLTQKTDSRENTKKENMSILKKLINLFSEGEVSLATLETELGPLTADAFEIGNVVYDAELNPVLDGEFTAEGKKYYTDNTGAIKEVEVLEVEEVDVEALKAKIEALTAEVEKLTKQQEEVLMENVELKNLQASTKLKAEVKGKSPITMTAKNISDDSTLSAIERITKKKIN